MAHSSVKGATRNLSRGIRTAVVVCATAFSLSLAVGCHPSATEVSQEVKNSLQQTIDSDQDLKSRHLRVDSVTVIRESGNVYQGLATVRSPKKSRQIALKITADGKNTMWRTDPGAFAVFSLDDLGQSMKTEAEDDSTNSEATSAAAFADRAVRIVKNFYRFSERVPESMRNGVWTTSEIPRGQSEIVSGSWVWVVVHYSIPEQDCQWRIGFPVDGLQDHAHDALDGCAKTMFEEVPMAVPGSPQ